MPNRHQPCRECDGRGISYVDHSKPVGHNYRIDHMNAHTCERCCGTGTEPKSEKTDH